MSSLDEKDAAKTQGTHRSRELRLAIESIGDDGSGEVQSESDQQGDLERASDDQR